MTVSFPKNWILYLITAIPSTIELNNNLPSVSINLIQNIGLIAKNYGASSKIYQRLCGDGILDAEKDGNGHQIVIPQSIDAISGDLKDILNRYGYSDADILDAISKRPKQRGFF